MKTPVGLRMTAWEPRQRLIAGGLTLLVVLGLSLWWLGGGDERRASTACGYLQDQQGALRTTVDEAAEAADRAAAAGESTVIGSFNNIDREFNSLRRWQSTYPRLVDSLGDVGSDGIDQEAMQAFEVLTDGVAEMQRLIEAAQPAEVLAWAPELEGRLANADALCARL